VPETCLEDQAQPWQTDQTSGATLPRGADVCLVPAEIPPLGRPGGTHGCVLRGIAGYRYHSHLDAESNSGIDSDKTQQETLERQLSAHLTADRTYLQQGVQTLTFANKAYDLYLKQPHEERAKLLQFLLWNSTLKDGNLCVTYRKPFDILANGVSHQLRRPQGDLNPCCRRERPVS
jgi:hypothetical protein